jgi:hypothetical protein
VLRWISVPLIAAVFALTAFQLRVRHEMPDFAVYRQAAQRVLKAEPLYQATDGHYQFKYLPAFAMLAIPFALVGDDTSKLIWFALSVGALMMLVRWSVRFLPARNRRIWVLASLASLFMAKFYLHELLLGQANIFFALVALAAVAAIQVEVPVAAGVLLGIAVCIKPYALLFAPWLLVNGQRRALAAFAATCAIALLAPSALYGVGGNIALIGDWWRTVSSTTAPNLTVTDNVSFAAMWAKWLGMGFPARIAAGVTSAFALGVVIDAWSRRKDVGEPDYLEAAMLLMLVPLLSPQGWDYVLLLGTPAVVLLLDRINDVSKAWRAITWTALALMGLTLFDVMGRGLYRQFMNWSIVTICAATLLVAVGQLRRRTLA